MARNYDSSATGVPYVRAPMIEIRYPGPLTANIRVMESEAVKLADGSVRELSQAGQLSWTLGPSDMATVLQLRDPTTGAAIPNATMTRQALMLGLLAEIRRQQLDRDAAEAAAAEAAQEPAPE